MSIIEKVILKNIGEGYCILTPQKIFPYVEYVDWLEGEDEEDGALTRATLHDDSTITGSGFIELWVVWHENVDKISGNDLKKLSELDSNLVLSFE
ncbi:hypothetical protein EXE10_03235 [Acinetobacter sp. WCHAc060033]|uniref:Uncharacterized protein n=1 Tax=Acinetobacter wuhouensis TaxID=1879050 RepID=A0A3G2T0N0_9GAMM|nr:MULTISPECIES: hypothetical protein [Acinetobacter]AYO53719.1 hypothetical protein CDG68_08810 [Acinetobacter wuhouensis]RZG88325.1 hypothetical protein EXE10_03235 [Acinetobacter sp. WCHAc060033]